MYRPVCMCQFPCVFQAQQGTELQKLNGDLAEMKKQKLKLMRQLKEDASVMKKKDQKREKSVNTCMYLSIIIISITIILSFYN